MTRMIAILYAFGLGWMLYIAAWARTYSEPLSMLTQPFCAAIVSGIILVLALVAGIFLKIPAIARYWTASSRLAWGMLGVSLTLYMGCLFFSSLDVITDTGRDEPYRAFPSQTSDIMFVCYCCAMFVVANWPVRDKKSEVSGP